jgi:hypothetical protein
VLQSAEQRPNLPVDFLIEFTRALIRSVPSSDLFYLAVATARRKVPISEEQEKMFSEAVGHEMERSSWPKGFF